LHQDVPIAQLRGQPNFQLINKAESATTTGFGPSLAVNTLQVGEEIELRREWLRGLGCLDMFYHFFYFLFDHFLIFTIGSDNLTDFLIDDSFNPRQVT